MIVTGKHLSRRAFLRGTGAVIALPMLDAMVPALASARAAAAKQLPLRMCFVYVPNGMVMSDWTPKGRGKDFEFSTILKPLEKFREQTLIVSGLGDQNANALGDGPGDHARASASFLTGAHPRESGSDIHAGVSADQVVAKQIGHLTRLPSLELGLEDNRVVGLCDSKYSCAYTSTISWQTPSSPLPPVANPRQVFDRLFGFGSADAGLPKDVAARRANYRQSILDGAMRETKELTGAVGPEDRRKLDEYLTSVREIEKRVRRIAEEEPVQKPAMDRPAGTPADYAEHAGLIFDLLALAFQTDVTRVSTMMIGRESSIRSYDQIGIPESHHQISHHRNDPANVAKLTKIQTYHVSLFAKFVEKLAAMKEGDGSVLDRSMILYGAGISDSNRHLHDKLPVAVVGGGLGASLMGQHVAYSSDVPVTNLLLTLMGRMDVRPERLGDSTGALVL
jgi:hypothetical protein